MTRETLREETRDHVRVLRLNRPEAKNAFNNRMYNELADALLEAGQTRDVRVVLVTGEGTAFSAGQDLTEMSNVAPVEGPVGFERLLDALSGCDKPIVAAVNGVALGIGMTMLGHTDINYFARSARLRCPFVTLGVVPEAGSSLLFPKAMGYQKTAEFLFTARWMSAEEAVANGLGVAVVADEEIFDVAFAKAAEIARMPPRAVQATKRLLKHVGAAELRETRTRENDQLRVRIGSPENAEALRAFFEKRAPDFASLPDE